MLSTHYHPPHDLPMISLTIKEGKLLALDWFNDKTQKLFERINANATFVARQDLDTSNDTPTADTQAFKMQTSVSTEDRLMAIQVCRQLDEYFLGERQTFDVPLDLSHGTDFQRQVWQALCDIPYGKTISYKQLAHNIGKPTAFRACANANGKNLISLIVPCHRVIASDGGLGGYTGGVDIKRKLLDIECVIGCTFPKK